MYAELFEDDVAAPSGTKVVQARTEFGTPLCPPKVEIKAELEETVVPEAEVEGQETAPVEEPGTEAPAAEEGQEVQRRAVETTPAVEYRGCRRGDHQLDLC